MSTETPLLVSPPWRRSRQQEYRVYSDRLRLQFGFFGARVWLTVPFSEIKDIRVCDPKGPDRVPLLESMLDPYFWWVFNYDWVNGKHVSVAPRNPLKAVSKFSPADPEAFVDKVRELLDKD